MRLSAVLLALRSALASVPRRPGVTSALLLVVSLGGVMGGAALIGTWALGLAIIADSVCVGVYALFHDDGSGRMPSAHDVPTLEQVLERARRAS